MVSERLWSICKTCGKTISAKARACPNCGAIQKHSGRLKWFGFGLAALIVLGIIAVSGDLKTPSTPDSSSSSTVSTSDNQANSKVALPADEIAFIDTVETHRRLFNGAKNELQQASI